MQTLKADVMFKSAPFLSTSRNVPFYLDLPRTEASCSAFIPCIQEVWSKNVLQRIDDRSCIFELGRKISRHGSSLQIYKI